VREIRVKIFRQAIRELEARHTALIFPSTSHKNVRMPIQKNVRMQIVSPAKPEVVQRPSLEDIGDEVAGSNARTVAQPSPQRWRVAAASAIAGGAAAVGFFLLAIAVIGASVEPNPYTALALTVGGVVLLATLITALREF
jgi:hypothetical protein